MPVADYADLVQTVSDYTGRGDMGAIIDRLIGLAELDIERTVQFGRQNVDVTLTLTTGRVALPTDFYAMRSVATTATPTVHLPRLSKHLEQTPDDYGPCGYVIDANEIVVLPKTTAQIKLAYFAKLPRLSASQPTNWLMDRAPDLLLSGAVYHAFTWANDDRATNAREQFAQRMVAVQKEESTRYWTNAVIMPAHGGGLP